MPWLNNNTNEDATQQLAPWLQALLKGGLTPTTIDPNQAQQPPFQVAPAQDPQAQPPAQDPSQVVPPMAPAPNAVDQMHEAAQTQAAPVAPVPALQNAQSDPNVPKWLTDPANAAVKAPFADPDVPQMAQPQQAVIPGRPRGPFDKIPDGEPGSDTWANRHNNLRKGLTILAAGLAEFGGRDPWGSNGRPGEGMQVLQPWLDAKQAQREYDVNAPALQQQAQTKLNTANAENDLRKAQADSQLIYDPTTGRYIPTKVAVAQTAAAPKALAAGFNPVTGKPLTAEESSRQQNAKVELDEAHKELFGAEQAQAQAKAELDQAQNDPTSPIYKLKLAQFQMVQKRFALAQERVSLAYRNFGVNTYGIDYGNSSALQSGAGGGTGHATAPGPTAGTPSNSPKGVPLGNDGQPLVANGPAIKAARNSMASGEDHKSALAFNTASGHISQLSDAIDALDNNNIKALNAIAVRYGVQTGNPAPVVFDAIRNAVSGELSRVFKGQPTDAEIEQNNATLSNTSAPATLKGVTTAYLNLMVSKLGALHDTYYQLTGEQPTNLLTPEAIQAFKKAGVALPDWAANASKGSNRSKAVASPQQDDSNLPTYDTNGKRIK